MYEWILYAIAAAFVGWEAIAHYVFHNGPEGKTASALIRALEQNNKYGWVARVVVAAAVILLGVHLETS